MKKYLFKKSILVILIGALAIFTACSGSTGSIQGERDMEDIFIELTGSVKEKDVLEVLDKTNVNYNVDETEEGEIKKITVADEVTKEDVVVGFNENQVSGVSYTLREVIGESGAVATYIMMYLPEGNTTLSIRVDSNNESVDYISKEFDTVKEASEELHNRVEFINENLGLKNEQVVSEKSMPELSKLDNAFLSLDTTLSREEILEIIDESGVSHGEGVENYSFILLEDELDGEYTIEEGTDNIEVLGTNGRVTTIEYKLHNDNGERYVVTQTPFEISVEGITEEGVSFKYQFEDKNNIIKFIR